MQPYEAQTSCLIAPVSGVDLGSKDEIRVLPFYYMRAEQTVTNISVWRCARDQACEGGSIAGNESCAAGHEGDLCGTCKPKHYRGRLQCEPCVDISGQGSNSHAVTQSIIILSTVGVLVIGLAALYLAFNRRASPHSTKSSSARPVGLSRMWAQATTLFSLVHARLVTGGVIFRILLGYCQCLSMTRRYLRVLWPAKFLRFLEALDQLTLEVFDLVPAECAFGPLGYHIELIATLVTPVALMLALFMLGAIVSLCTRRSLCKLFNWPQIWDLAVWLLLIQFPTISRKTLTVFDCVPYYEQSLLRSDPTLHCYDGQWFMWAPVAAIGAGVYCLGLPFAAWLVSRRLHSGNASTRRLVYVLTRSYTESCWFMESVDLVRKFLLTGAITLVAPQSKLQLWFGQVVNLTFLLIHMRLMPFRDPICNFVQFAVHVQLLLTYTSAGLFFVDDANVHPLNDDNDTAGFNLILCNCAAFALVIFIGLQGARRIILELAAPRLTFSDGVPIVLKPPMAAAADGFHLFISHVWKDAQDQAGTLKSALRGLVPSCITFLDVDDLKEISKVPEYVKASDVMLVLVTESYLTSVYCRYELIAAMDSNKPLILLLETDPNKGAVSAAELFADVIKLQRAGSSEDHCQVAAIIASLVASQSPNPPDPPPEVKQLLERPSAAKLSTPWTMTIQWQREKHLKQTVLKAIVAALLRAQASTGVRQVEDPLTLRAGDEDEATREQSRPTLFDGRRKVYLCKAYRELPGPSGGANAYDEFSERLAANGVDVTDERPTRKVPSIVLLCPGAFENQDIVVMIMGLLRQQRLHSIGRHASFAAVTNISSLLSSHSRSRSSGNDTVSKDAAPPLFITLYSTVLPFAAYMANCDEFAKGVKDLGLFNHFFLKWPPFELLQRAVLESKILPLLPELSPEVETQTETDVSDVLQDSLHQPPSLPVAVGFVVAVGDEEAAAGAHTSSTNTTGTANAAAESKAAAEVKAAAEAEALAAAGKVEAEATARSGLKRAATEVMQGFGFAEERRDKDAVLVATEAFALSSSTQPPSSMEGRFDAFDIASLEPDEQSRLESGTSGGGRWQGESPPSVGAASLGDSQQMGAALPLPAALPSPAALPQPAALPPPAVGGGTAAGAHATGTAVSTSTQSPSMDDRLDAFELREPDELAITVHLESGASGGEHRVRAAATAGPARAKFQAHSRRATASPASPRLAPPTDGGAQLGAIPSTSQCV